MLLFARIGAWAFAVFFGVAPVLFTIVKDPALVSKLVNFSSYNGMTKDLILSAIAIQAIGFVDATEATISDIGKSNTNNNIAGASILLLMVIVIHITLCVNWISGEHSRLENINSIPIWAYSSMLVSLAARLLLIAGDA